MPAVRLKSAGALVTLVLVLAGPARAQVEPPIARTPGPHPRGTVILLPASGWASPARHAQVFLWERMAPMLHRAGYRAVAIDFPAGATPAMEAIGRVVRDERRRTPGPLCLYGESSGGHLAAVAGYRMREVDCVITWGAPFDFAGLAEDAERHPERLGYRNVVEAAIEPTFGADPAGWAGWQLSDMLTPSPAPVLAMICADDALIPRRQVRALPGADTFVAEPGDLAYVHGTVSPAGLKASRVRIKEFLARAVSERRS